MRDINDYTDNYKEEPFEPTMVEIRKRMVIEQCNKYKHDSILEIGCGLNPFFLDFKDYKRMMIVEPGDMFADNAEHMANENDNVEVVRGFLEDKIDVIKSKEIDLDFIILSSVLHELDNPKKMLSAINSICTKETVVHVNVPNAKSIHRLIGIEAGIIQDVHEQSEQMIKMQRRRTYDMELLGKELEEANFVILDKGTYFFKPFTHAQMQKLLDLGMMDEKTICGLEKVIKYFPEYGAGIYMNIRKKN